MTPSKSSDVESATPSMPCTCVVPTGAIRHFAGPAPANAPVTRSAGATADATPEPSIGKLRGVAYRRLMSAPAHRQDATAMVVTRNICV